MLRYIPESEVRAVLTYETLIPPIRQALIDYSLGPLLGSVEQPPRTVIRVKDQQGSPSGWFATMPAVSGEFMAVKTVTFFPGNAMQPGGPPATLPTHQATIELLSRATGQPLAIMDGRLITEMRTAAVSAVAFQTLADPSVQTLGIIGSGVQARSHVEALRLAHPAFQEPANVLIASRGASNAARLAKEMNATPATIEEAAGCDVVVTATSAQSPILMGEWLAHRAVVLAVGAVGPKLRELDDAVMQGTVVAESRQGVESESGDLILSGAKVFAEIGEILAHIAPAPAAGRIVFKSVGMAIEDLTAAALVWKALQKA